MDEIMYSIHLGLFAFQKKCGSWASSSKDWDSCSSSVKLREGSVFIKVLISILLWDLILSKSLVWLLDKVSSSSLSSSPDNMSCSSF